MPKTWSLKKTVQCAKCPWKVAVDPNTIPNGYSVEKHLALADTIANPGELSFGNRLPIMACHEEDEVHCVGWLHNQLGRGNNIPLRLSMSSCANAKDITVIGEQHPYFESTLPER